MVRITNLENKALLGLADLMHAERGFSDVDVADLSDKTDIPVKELRGVMSSLIKKQLIEVDEDWDNIIYLTELTEGLVPDWLLEGAPYPVDMVVV